MSDPPGPAATCHAGAMSDVTATDWLVTTDWLSEHLDDDSVRVLDVSGWLDEHRRNLAHDAYLAEHIPGAVWFDVASGDGELSDPASELSWTWPPLPQIEATMGRFGVDNDTTRS